LDAACAVEERALLSPERRNVSRLHDLPPDQPGFNHDATAALVLDMHETLGGQAIGIGRIRISMVNLEKTPERIGGQDKGRRSCR